MNLVLLVVLPVLFWDKGPETKTTIAQAGIKQIAVPAASAAAWSGVSDLQVTPLDPARLVKLPAPSLSFDTRTASATRAAWVHTNGWQFLRNPDGGFLYETPGENAGLAAAEAFSYQVRSAIHTDDAGLSPLARMLAFLVSVPKPASLEPRGNIGYIDDGTPQSGEFMNMLVRRNLLFRVVKAPDPSLDLTVSLNDPDYPRSGLANPKLLAEKVRANLGDDKRILRIYGSEVVIGRVLGTSSRARVLLLNYGAARRFVAGLRIRVRGAYKMQHAYADGVSDCHLQDVKADSEATEFTLPRLNTIAVVDLE